MQAEMAHSPRLQHSPSGVESHNNTDTVQTSLADAIHAARKRVERVVELYVFIADEPLQIKLNSAILAEVKEMRFGSGSDLREWHLTVGAILARIKRSCVMCRPAFGPRREVCIHAAELLRSAKLRMLIENAARVERVTDSQLGSQTRRKRMSARDIARAEQRRREARAAKDEARHERNSIVHRHTYEEAIEMFDMACRQGGENVWRYCMREM